MISRRKFIGELAIAFATAGCAGGMPSTSNTPSEPSDMPIISALTYTATDTTIVATWATDVSSDSNLNAGGKAAIDNGLAPSGTSHQAIVTGLSPSTIYSCFVTSGGTSSTPQNIATSAARTRTPIHFATLGIGAQMPSAGPVHGDTHYTFVSSDNKTYITECDGYGFVASTPDAGANMQVSVLTNETTFAGTNTNLLTAYGGYNTTSGTDGPTGIALTNKITGVFGLLGNLYVFAARQDVAGGGAGVWYNNVIKSTDHGVTWNNYQAPSTFNAAGSPINTATFPLAQKTYGWVSPVLYGADDGTLGYNASGNQIDGANGFVYCSFVVSAFVTPGGTQVTPAYMLRVPRIQFDSGQLSTGVQYWIGPASPAPSDFVNDANWSSSDASKTITFQPASATSWPIVTFLPAINRYVLTTARGINATQNITTVYEAPTPAGPWTQIYVDGGGNTQQWYGFMPMHRDWFSNVATDNIGVRVIASGSGPNNSFTTFYYPTAFTLTLRTSGVANSFVQGNANTAGGGIGNPYTLAFPGSVTKGNLLIAAVRHGNECTVTSIKGTLNTANWNLVFDTLGNTTFLAWAWVVSNASGAETVTVTYNVAPSTNGTVGLCAEYSGMNAPRVTPFPAGNVGVATTTPTSNALTSVAGDLVLGFTQSLGSQTPGSVAAGTGYTIREKGLGGDFNCYIAQEDNLSAAGGSTTASFTMPTSSTFTTGIGAFFLFSSSMVQLVSYGFTTIENPLSNGGNFTENVSAAAPLQVVSSGVCEPSAVGSNGAYWSGAVPPGDTGGAFPADQYVEVTVLTIATGGGTDLIILRVRQSPGANTAYQVSLPGTTGAPTSQNAAVYFVVAGTATQIGSSFPIIVSSGDVMRFIVTGQGASTTLTTLQNGNVIDQRTDSGGNVAGPGVPSFFCNAGAAIANSRVSHFAAGANQAASPTFSPPAGGYGGPQTVTLSGPVGSTIYYTLDGSTPTRSSSNVPTGGTVSVTPPKTLKAISSAANFADSPIVTGSYTVGAGGDLGPGYDFKYRF